MRRFRRFKVKLHCVGEFREIMEKMHKDYHTEVRHLEGDWYEVRVLKGKDKANTLYGYYDIDSFRVHGLAWGMSR